MTWRNVAILLVIVGASMVPAGAADQAVDLPVRRIVLFSSGVGYFEHIGQVAGDATATLLFKTDQINDVLKSMVVIDDAGGAVSIHYASRDPLARALRSFAVDLSGRPTLAELLGQIRGAKVDLSAPEKITGTILGLETQTRQLNTPGGSTVLKEAYLNLLTDQGIQSVPVGTIQSLHLQDETLRSEIDKALRLILAASDKQRKGVEIRFTGKDKRPVRVGYVTETPVWKVSYRLELSGKTPYLQGWAIVENTTDQDWSDVQLSLISGRPISFIQDLYTPLYLPRPVVQPAMYASLRPQKYAEGIADEKKAGTGVMPGERLIRTKKTSEAPRARAEMLAEYRGAAPEGDVVLDSVQAAAAAGKVGELFSFTIQDPVHLSRRRSAMLPILSRPIAAEKVSIYNQRVMPKHPLNGAWITNDTGLKMLAGPMTVFDNRMYAGDAQLGNLAENDKRLVSYALDLDMTVDPSAKTASRVTAVKIVKGVMTLTFKDLFTQLYKIKNKASAERTLIIEQPRHAGRTLLEPKKCAEKTPSLYRFKRAIPKDATQEFSVVEEKARWQTVRLIEQDERMLLHYAKTGQLSDAARQALTEAARKKQDLATAENRLAELQKQKAAVEAGQSRLRENIKTVGQTSSLGKRYIEKLSKQEDQIETLAQQIEKMQARVETLRNQLAEFIHNLNF